ncbi:MAG: Fic family protein [Muribaculaceae bacterium]|nr:Fic family protein [Muribaculaceae bacterium]
MSPKDFDEYIKQVEPSAQESANAWRTAIGLQAVDGLKTSPYLLDIARQNINGDVTIDEVRELLDTYYKSKTTRTAVEDMEEEADKVAANIKKILSSRTIAFNTNGFIATHRRIFEGVFKHAGKIRQYDITKKEWVLRGATVNYLNWEDIKNALDYDIQQERDFSYKHLSDDDKIKHICRFVSGLWQIHPFQEGNTRTTAVFIIQYLRSIGYNVTNTLFEEHSWYFRNALVRANYKNSQLGIDYDFSFLEKFFQNLLMNKNHELKNRYLIIEAPEGFDKEDSLSLTDDKKAQTDDKLNAILEFIAEKGECKTIEIAAFLGLKPTQTKSYIYRLISDGKILAKGNNRNRTYSLV